MCKHKVAGDEKFMVVCKIVAFTKGKRGWHQKKVDGFFHLGYVCFFFLFFFFVNRILKRFFLNGCLWSQTFLAIHLSALKSGNLFICSFSNFITASQILVRGLC